VRLRIANEAKSIIKGIIWMQQTRMITEKKRRVGLNFPLLLGGGKGGQNSSHRC